MGDLSSFRDFLITRQGVRNQMLLKIVASAKQLSNSNTHTNAMSYAKPQSSPRVPNTAQFIASIEELYTSESNWQTECSEFYDNTFQASSTGSKIPGRGNGRRHSLNS